ncbi:hypothetical protein EYF80_052536 [Liparis tanakae]|uniref:Uncharacterized protein n=1 Tax=Liparis tanakae TaxID=230148 RepID=A0A4Z2F7T7_9TELE|nr:hypothetical protein EYF80_052536 [Liparis tanakae]
MGGLSLMSVTVMMAVAVLERPKFRLPSMSVACTMMVYWDTFCGKKENKRQSEASPTGNGIKDATYPAAPLTDRCEDNDPTDGD